MMKVAHLIDSGGLYGAEQVLLTLCKQQQQQGIEPLLVSCGLPGEEEKPIERAAREQSIPLLVWRMPAGLKVREAKKLLDFLDKNGIKLLHSHGYKFNILIALIKVFFGTLPAITTLHGYTKSPVLSKGAIYRLLDRLSLIYLDSVVLVSPTIKMSRLGLKNKISFIPNGIPAINNFCEINNVSQHDNYVIGSVGRLNEEKNFLFLINLMPKILEKFPNTKLFIHGDGVLRKSLESQINLLGVKDSVFLPGYISDVNSFLKNIDLYINCSTTEGMPITLLESMRVGCLMLASDIPANRFLLGKEFNTLLFDLNDCSFMERFAAVRFNQLGDLEIIKERLKSNFLMFYTDEKMAKSYRKLYMELV